MKRNVYTGEINWRWTLMSALVWITPLLFWSTVFLIIIRRIR